MTKPKDIREVLWNFHIDLNEQQKSGRSVTQGNTEIFAEALSSIVEIIGGEKKEDKYGFQYQWNCCIDHLVKKIKESEE